MTAPSGPDETAAQRAAAYANSLNIRQLRAQLKRDLRRRGAAAGSEMARILQDPPTYLQSALIFDVLAWLPGVKSVRADAMLQEAKVTGGLRTVGELTERQRSALAELVLDPPSATHNPNRPAPKRTRVAAPILDDIAF